MTIRLEDYYDARLSKLNIEKIENLPDETFDEVSVLIKGNGLGDLYLKQSQQRRNQIIADHKVREQQYDTLLTYHHNKTTEAGNCERAALRRLAQTNKEIKELENKKMEQEFKILNTVFNHIADDYKQRKRRNIKPNL